MQADAIPSLCKAAAKGSASFLQFRQEKGTCCYFKLAQMQANGKIVCLFKIVCRTSYFHFSTGPVLVGEGLAQLHKTEELNAHSHEDRY